MGNVIPILTSTNLIRSASYSLCALLFISGWQGSILSPALSFTLSALCYVFGFFMANRKPCLQNTTGRQPSTNELHSPIYEDTNIYLEANQQTHQQTRRETNREPIQALVNHQPEDSEITSQSTPPLDLPLDPPMDPEELSKSNFPLSLIFVLTAIGLSLFYVSLQNFRYIDSQASVNQLYNQGLLCEQEGDISCSVDIFNRILEIEPNDLLAIGHLGLNTKKQGNQAGALELFQRYFEQGGDAINILYDFAEHYYALNQKEKSYPIYQRIVTINDQYPDVIRRILSILIEKKNYEEAQSLLKKHIHKNPQNENLFQNEEKIIQRALNNY